MSGKHRSAAVDATGLETRHSSRHFRWRCGEKLRTKRDWPKLTAALDTGSQLIVGAAAGRGPSQDSPEFAPAVRQAVANAAPRRILADKAYDAEHNHALCRDLGVRSTAIPIDRRNATSPPATPLRRGMHDRFPCRKYRDRAQAESGFSRHKRRLGSALTARTGETQAGELLLRTLVHNILILADNA